MGMSYLIDTHILLWWVFDNPKLDESSRAIIANPEHLIMVSSATAWEIATKYRIGKLSQAKTLVENYEQVLSQAGFQNCPSLPPTRSEPEAYRSPTAIPLTEC